MKRISAVMLVFTLALPALWAVEEQFQAGKILSIEQKTHSHILYYLVNTPITQDDLYVQVKVQVKDTIYVAEFTPAHAKQTLPEDWKSESPIKARVEKRSLFLKQDGESEFQLLIVKRMAATSAPSVPGPAQN